jgi:hypothetical protein
VTIGRWVWLGVPLIALGSGCGMAPKSFEWLNNPSGITRARAASLGTDLPSDVVIPALIDKLNDPDSVVRLAANEELKKTTHQDFGFEAWGELEERQAAHGRWRKWWKQHEAAMAKMRAKQ